MLRASASCLFAMALSISVASRAEDPTTTGQPGLPGRKGDPPHSRSVRRIRRPASAGRQMVSADSRTWATLCRTSRASVKAFCTAAQVITSPLGASGPWILLAAGKSPAKRTGRTAWRGRPTWGCGSWEWSTPRDKRPSTIRPTRRRAAATGAPSRDVTIAAKATR